MRSFASLATPNRGRELPRPDMPDALEILSGLRPGDVLVRPNLLQLPYPRPRRLPAGAWICREMLRCRELTRCANRRHQRQLFRPRQIMERGRERLSVQAKSGSRMSSALRWTESLFDLIATAEVQERHALRQYDAIGGREDARDDSQASYPNAYAASMRVAGALRGARTAASASSKYW